MRENMAERGGRWLYAALSGTVQHWSDIEYNRWSTQLNLDNRGNYYTLLEKQFYIITITVNSKDYQIIQEIFGVDRIHLGK